MQIIRRKDDIRYRVWNGILQRCNNPKDPKYSVYGGRGISVCERWKNFDAFAGDMPQRPSLDFVIDRIDNDGNYEKSNCRWITWLESRRHKRPPKAKELKPSVRKAVLLGFGLLKCGRCAQVKFTDEFHKYSSRWSSYNSTCKTCVKASIDPAKARERTRLWAQKRKDLLTFK